MNETKDPSQGQSAGEQSDVAPAKKKRSGAKPSAPQKSSGNTRQTGKKTATAKASSPPGQTSSDSASSNQPPQNTAPKDEISSSSLADSKPAKAKSPAKTTGKSAGGKSASKSGKAPQSKKAETGTGQPTGEAKALRALEGNKAKALEGNTQQQLTGSSNKALPASAVPALEAPHREVLEAVEREALEGRRQKAIEQGEATPKPRERATGNSVGKKAAASKTTKSASEKTEDSTEAPAVTQNRRSAASGSRKGRSASAKTSTAKASSAKAASADVAEVQAEAPQVAAPQAETSRDNAPQPEAASQTVADQAQNAGDEPAPTTAEAKPSRGRGRRSGASKKAKTVAASASTESSTETVAETSTDTTDAPAAEASDVQDSRAKDAAGRKKTSSGRRRGGRKPRVASAQEEADLSLEKEADFDLDAPLDDVSPAAATDLDSDFDEAPAEPAQEGRGKKAQPQVTKQARRKMFVCVHPEEQVEVVLTEEGQVQEYFVEMLQQAKTKGNIYKATINNLDANLQAAFVSYGANKNGFLQIDEVHPEYFNTPHDTSKNRRYPPIQKALKQGQELLVQVVKEPSGTKGAFLTTYLSLPGRFLVLTPGREQIGVSRKVDNEEERSRLREMLTGLKPGPGLGVIVRTVSVGTSKSTLQKDLQNLKRTWKEIRKRGTEEPAPTLIYQEMSLTTRAVRDYLTDQVVEVWIDDEETAKSVDEMAKIHFPQKTRLVNLHKGTDATLFERFNLQRQLDQIHSREVTLPSGGRLVIDPTEALTAIDINSGRSGGKNNFEDMAYRTNIEAAKVIPLQLRLRDIGGQVVIDFIEMRDKNHWREVEKTIRAGMKNDRARHDIGRVSPFGLMELVRQRLGSSAISVSTEVCPHCKGTGVRRNMEWQTQTALRDIDRKLQVAKDQGQISLIFEVEATVAMHLLNTKRQRLVEMEQQYGVHLEIVPTH